MGMLQYEDFVQGLSEIVVVGLGYVGLPLAVSLAEHFRVLGFDISRERIRELQQGRDRTNEVDPSRLSNTGLRFTSEPADLGGGRLLIVAVPTPIDANNRPDLEPTRKASLTVGQHLSPGAVVVFESTVYPGLTEEFCVPILERESGLQCGRDFAVGYSPERINPGDKAHTLENIVKVVAGQNQAVTDFLARIYGTVVRAGVYRAASIKVAEAAKVIENTQRDLNIALMNELALIFQRLGIDTLQVLEAAGTKWNFLPFRPGLVGGHCIGVDPYYLTFKAEALDYHPQVILAGRRINDGMGEFVAQSVVKRLIQLGCSINGARVAVLGLTFKENVPDIRNTRVTDIIRELESYCVEVLVHDPLADEQEVEHELGLSLRGFEELTDIDGLVLAVPHARYREIGLHRLRSCFRASGQGLLADIKGLFSPSEGEEQGLSYWRL